MNFIKVSLLILLPFFGAGQVSTFKDLRASRSFVPPNYDDTTQANLLGARKANALITVDEVLWQRNEANTRWQTPATGGTVTASNGLTMSTATNVKWGGALTGATAITSGSYNTQFSGSNTSPGVLSVQGTGAGSVGFYSEGVSRAITAYTVSGYGIHAQSNTNTAVYAYTGSGRGVFSTSDSSYAFEGTTKATVLPVLSLTNTQVVTGAIQDMIVLKRVYNKPPSTPPPAGIGQAIKFQTSTGYYEAPDLDVFTTTSNRLISKWTDPTYFQAVSEFSITGVNNAVESDLLTLSGNGRLKLNKYILSTFDDLTPFRSLGLNATGELVTFTAAGGSTYTADNGLTMNTAINELGGTLNRYTPIAAGSYEIAVTGNKSGDVFSVSNSAFSGAAIYGNGAGGAAIGVRGYSGYGTGVSGLSIGGSAVSGSATGGYGGSFYSSAGTSVLAHTSGTSVLPTLVLKHTNTSATNYPLILMGRDRGVSSLGDAQMIDYYFRHNNSYQSTGARFESTLVEQSSTEMSSDFKFWVSNLVEDAGTVTLRQTFTIDEDGDVIFNRVRTFADTAAAAADITLETNAVYKVTGSPYLHIK